MIGIDIVKISRMENRSEAFLHRVLTPQEREYFVAKKRRAETLAGLFAAKEAVLKALGTGLSEGVSLTELEITHTESGAPRAGFTGKAAEYFTAHFPGAEIAVSISHDGEYAVASAYIYGGQR